MSFLYRVTPVLRIAAARPSPRLFSTAIVYQKSATETVKDGLKAVDRTVSDAAVAGIDKGVELKDKAAEASGVNTNKSASEVAGDLKGKASEAAESAGIDTNKSASEVAGDVKGKASEVTGAAKGKASEMTGEAKGKAEEVKGKL